MANENVLLKNYKRMSLCGFGFCLFVLALIFINCGKNTQNIKCIILTILGIWFMHTV